MKFKVGDVCIVVFSDNSTWPVGSEVTIQSIGDCPWFGGSKDLFPYGIGREVWCKEACLKLKAPPQKPEELGSWDLCPWQPKEIHV